MNKQIKTIEPPQVPRHKHRKWPGPLKSMDLERLVWDCEYREAMRPYWRQAG